MDKKSKSQKSRPTNIAAFALLFLIIMGVLATVFLGGLFRSPPKITWQEFEKNILSRNAVKEIVVANNVTALIYIKDDFKNDSSFHEVFVSPLYSGKNQGPHYTFNIGSVESFEKKLERAEERFHLPDRISVRYEEKKGIGDLLSLIIPMVILFFILRIFLNARSGGGTSIINFSRSTARLMENKNKSSVTFDDVAGLEEAKQEVKEVVDFLKDADRYTKLGAKIPKGIIIVGPPGTGKTLLARAVAGEAQVPFFSLSGSEFVEMFVGVGASRVRDLFKRAKEKAPCIVFIDEIDAVGRSRGRNTFYSGANDERESTLNQLLTEMDGFSTNSGVIVLAATNRADVLDPALLRPGRFDRHIYLELPTQAERKEIFKVHLRPLIIDVKVDPDFLASQTPGFSGADIANICNEAALIAARGKKSKVEMEHFSDAIFRIIAGIEKKSKIISPEEKKIIAYHEAGHTVVSWLLKYIDPVLKVSIIPRGKSLGAAWYIPAERQIRTQTEFTQRLIASLAGRAAEDVVFGEVSSGAMDDLEKVTKDAYTMVAYFGFNERIGNVSFYDSSGRYENGFQKPYGEDTAKLIDVEVRQLIEECYQQAKSILIEHRQELNQIAQLLLQKEMVFKDEIEKILGDRRNDSLIDVLPQQVSEV